MAGGMRNSDAMVPKLQHFSGSPYLGSCSTVPVSGKSSTKGYRHSSNSSQASWTRYSSSTAVGPSFEVPRKKLWTCPPVCSLFLGTPQEPTSASLLLLSEQLPNKFLFNHEKLKTQIGRDKGGIPNSNRLLCALLRLLLLAIPVQHAPLCAPVRSRTITQKTKTTKTTFCLYAFNFYYQKLNNSRLKK